jgi:hypothetical protein
MEPISTFLTLALGYILKGAAQSQAAHTAKEELLGGFWQWLRPLFIKDVPAIEKRPEAPETETKAQEKLLELIKDKTLFEELVKRVNELQKVGIREKNVVHGSIRRVKKIHIGDKEYTPDAPFDRKNVVFGDVEDAEEFTLGDGHF